MKTKFSSILKTSFIFTILMPLAVYSQNCTQSFQYPNGTVAIGSAGTTTIDACNWAGDYSVVSFTTAGSYVVNAVGGASNYITITDNSNNPVGSGFAPLGVVIPSVGIYRVHFSLSPAGCGTENTCRLTTISSATFCNSSSQYPAGTTNIPSGGTTQVTNCNWGGEYSVNNFSATGVYTITGTGGAGNYFTVKNASGSLIYAAGSTPLTVQIPYAGIYWIHISVTAPTTCSTDAVCHTVTVISPAPPPPPPANDVCTNAIALAVPGSTTGTTVLATVENPIPGACLNTLNQPGVWYSITGNGNKIFVDLDCSSNWDSKIFVYTGACGSTSCLASNDDFGPVCLNSAAASASWCSVPGTVYRVLVTGYSSPSAFTINVTQTVVPTPSIVALQNTVCAGSSVPLLATGATSYSWGPLGSTSIAILVSPTVNTTYTLTETDSGCFNTAVSTISVSPSPTVSVAPLSLCSPASGVLTANGATTYSWNTGATSASISVSPSVTTTYTVTGTSSGCSSSVTTTVQVTPTPTLVISGASVICQGQSATLTVSGASNYSWSTGSTSSIITVSPASNTVYIAGGLNGLCGNVQQHSVTVNPNPTVTVNSTSICSSASATLMASGAASYSWNTGSTSPNLVVTPASTTVYTVTGTNSLNCSGVEQATVEVYPTPTLTLIGDSLICSGETTTISASGATTYSWNNGAGTPTIAVSPTTTTTYTVTGHINACSSDIASTITVTPMPTLAVAGSLSICTGSTLNLSGTGAASYTWNSSSNTATIVATPTINTTYTLTGANGDCTVQMIVEATVHPNPTVTATSERPAICAGESVELSATGAANYQWTGAGLSGNTGASVTASPAVSGQYTVAGTSAQGCASNASVSITVDPCTGLAENNHKSSGIRIFPNPSSGIFTVESGNGKIRHVDVLDLSGRLIMSEDREEDVTDIDLSYFANGVYYVRVSGDSTIEVFRLIKQ